MIDFDTKDFERGLLAGIAQYELEGEHKLHALSEEIVAAAKQRAPVDTGRLRNAIGVRSSGRDAHGPYVDVGVDSSALGDDRDLANEYGTSTVDAHPFMRPAFAEAPGKFK